jgi:hypothetical protein
MWKEIASYSLEERVEKAFLTTEIITRDEIGHDKTPAYIWKNRMLPLGFQESSVILKI